MGQESTFQQHYIVRKRESKQASRTNAKLSHTHSMGATCRGQSVVGVLTRSRRRLLAFEMITESNESGSGSLMNRPIIPSHSSDLHRDIVALNDANISALPTGSASEEHCTGACSHDPPASAALSIRSHGHSSAAPCKIDPNKETHKVVSEHSP